MREVENPPRKRENAQRKRENATREGKRKKEADLREFGEGEDNITMAGM